MRALALLPVALFLGVSGAWAQGTPKAAADCGQLTMVNTIQMVRDASGSADMIPLGFVNGGNRYFLFDTGGARTQITRSAANHLNLSVSSGTMLMVGVTGPVSSGMTRVDSFVLGHMRGGPQTFPVSIAPLGMDGIFALDYLVTYDADVDFGTDKLNFFSPDHCPGAVQYWTAPVVAALPMTVSGDNHIEIEVELDGHKFKAIVDSGATNTTLRQDLATYYFDMAMGTEDTPESGSLNGVADLKVYRHRFKSLTFGPVEVSNPSISLIPYPHAPIGIISNNRGPEMIIGMDVLRKLHLYMAFKEKMLYVSQASPEPAQPSPLPDSYVAHGLDALDDSITYLTKMGEPSDTRDEDNLAQIRAARCLWRGYAKKQLDEALADCDSSLKAKADNATALTAKGLVLFQQAKYQDAMDGEDAALKIDPKSSIALVIRAYAKGKLGDAAGHDADIAAAKAVKPGIQIELQRLGIAG